jgi:hypothetical protein
MRDWSQVNDRREATIAFAKYMKDHPEDRQKCLDDPNEAKRQFAKRGEFYLQGEEPKDAKEKPIPKDVQFKVYDSKDQNRQKSVVLVLPSAKGDDSDEATDIWIAAWPPWEG